MFYRVLSEWSPNGLQVGAVSLDLDGTIVDSEAIHRLAHRAILSLLHIKVKSYVEDEESWQNITWGHGDWSDQGTVWFKSEPTVIQGLYDRLLMAIDVDLARYASIEQYMRMKSAYILNGVRDRTVEVTIVPGINEMVDFLANTRAPIGICTGSPGQLARAMVEQAGIAEHVTHWVTADDLLCPDGTKHPGKPHPYSFLCSFSALEERSNEKEKKGLRLVLEDTPGGAMAAHRAGALCLLRPSFENLEGAIAQLEKLHEGDYRPNTHPIIIFDNPSAPWTLALEKLGPCLSIR